MVGSLCVFTLPPYYKADMGHLASFWKFVGEDDSG
jgi:hypothetical protein